MILKRETIEINPMGKAVFDKVSEVIKPEN